MQSNENNQPTCSTYRVEFNTPTFDLSRTPIVVCDEIPELELAVGFALNLHRSSNVPHVIRVVQGYTVEITFNRD